MWSAERKSIWFSDLFKVEIRFKQEKFSIPEQNEAAAV
jgi:hypothetical protein